MEFFFQKKVHDVKIGIIWKGRCFILKFSFFILFVIETVEIAFSSFHFERRFNPLQPGVAFLYLLKTLENLLVF